LHEGCQIIRHGKPDVLGIEDLPPWVPGPDEALIRIVAASIKSSDLRNVQGLTAPAMTQQ
jgi:NADPH:quinone reductase-like Zn-dependent oxidoreductase